MLNFLCVVLALMALKIVMNLGCYVGRRFGSCLLSDVFIIGWMMSCSLTLILAVGERKTGLPR